MVFEYNLAVPLASSLSLVETSGVDCELNSRINCRKVRSGIIFKINDVVNIEFVMAINVRLIGLGWEGGCRKQIYNNVCCARREILIMIRPLCFGTTQDQLKNTKLRIRVAIPT